MDKTTKQYLFIFHRREPHDFSQVTSKISRKFYVELFKENHSDLGHPKVYVLKVFFLNLYTIAIIIISMVMLPYSDISNFTFWNLKFFWLVFSMNLGNFKQKNYFSKCKILLHFTVTDPMFKCNQTAKLKNSSHFSKY